MIDIIFFGFVLHRGLPIRKLPTGDNLTKYESVMFQTLPWLCTLVPHTMFSVQRYTFNLMWQKKVEGGAQRKQTTARMRTKNVSRLRERYQRIINQSSPALAMASQLAMGPIHQWGVGWSGAEASTYRRMSR